MKKVLLIASDLGKGGAERSISLLSYYLQDRYEVTLCILSGRDRQSYYKTCDNLVFIDPPQARSWFGKLSAWRYRLRKLRQLKASAAIDVSISFLEGPDYANVLSRVTEKVVLSIRGSKLYDGQISGLMGRMRKSLLIPFFYRKADQIVCVTDALCRELSDHFSIKQDKISTIYNFYETEDILARADMDLTRQEQRIFEQPVIITSGRLHMQKEHDKLIRTFALLRRQKEARLMILGDGELKVNLMALAQELGLSVCDWSIEQRPDCDVYFMGYQANAFKFYSRSRLFVLSSSWEGFPNVLAEALICQLPVVTSDCYTGPREILNLQGLGNEPVSHPLRNAVGSLMPLLQNATTGIYEAWTQEILHWLNAPAPEKNNFTRLTERFRLAAMLENWEQVIEN
jgi:glycosyltransferase involved in cell wall biosynthesis